jgi:beta-1,2-mannosidase
MVKMSDWVIGPFSKYVSNPVLAPSAKGFDSWATYNAAVVVSGGKFYMYYRAESRDEMDTPYCGTSRIGLALSCDGYHWERFSDRPMIDATLKWELPGGCEDPRIVKVGNIWHMLYTGYAYPDHVFICDAVSDDLLHWEKKGPIFSKKSEAGISSKSACTVCNPEGEAVKINGRYIMYTNQHIAFSTDFENWEVNDFTAASFSGRLSEVCVAVTDYRDPGHDDIVLFMAGTLDKICPGSDLFYAIGEALYSREDPTKLIDYATQPVIKAEHDYEKSIDRLYMVRTAGKGTLFLDSVIKVNDKWFAYYGASDQYVAMATARY